MQRVFRQFEAMFFRDGMLATFNFFVEKLFHMAALQAQQVIVMAAAIEFVHRLIVVEVMPNQDASMLELGQHAVHRGQADIDAVSEEKSVYVIRREVASVSLLEQGEDFQARAGDFQAQSLELIGAGHGG
jgi:hypothetical protein